MLLGKKEKKTYLGIQGLKRLGIGLMLVGFLLVASYAVQYYFTDSGNESIEVQLTDEQVLQQLQQQTQEIICKKKQEKEMYLNSLTYQETAQYMQGKFTSEYLQSLDEYISGTQATCSGIKYDKINPTQLFGKNKGVQKVVASEPTKKEVTAELQQNSWKRTELQGEIEECEAKTVERKKDQDLLHEINERIRKQFESKGGDIATIIKQTKLRDTQKTCKLDGKETTLGALVYAFIRQEGGMKPGSAGLETNNPGSLRVDHGVVKIKGTSHIDNTKNWLVYYTLEDGIYHLSYVVSEKYGCDIGWKSILCYIKGCNAEVTPQIKQDIDNKYANFISYIKEYE